jgi:hypothetical protein
VRIVGPLALVVAAGSLVAVRCNNNTKDTVDVIVVADASKETTSTVDSAPVFYIENKTRKPASCADVTVTKSSNGLFGVSARSDDKKRTIQLTVRDPLPEESVGPAATNIASTRSLAGRLVLEAIAVGGTDAENQAGAMQALNAADLATSADPQSLKVTWPTGYRELHRGVPWVITGDLQRQRNLSSEEAEEEDLSPRPSLTWSSIDDGGRTTLGGVTVGADVTPLFGTSTIDGFAVMVMLSGDQATQSTQADVDKLATLVQALPFRCTAAVSKYTVNPETATRFTGSDWIAYLDSNRRKKNRARSRRSPSTAGPLTRCNGFTIVHQRRTSPLPDLLAPRRTTEQLPSLQRHRLRRSVYAHQTENC